MLAFPVGLVAALGRRSRLPAIRVLSVGYIELFRGVPLVAFLFIGQYLVIYAVPTFVDPPSFLVRALIVIALFESAYIAEIVRGGLQSVPEGQVEAAQALGLGPVQTMRRVVLPQALRTVIPAIVGQFISLFKDTSLLAIVGFFEILEVARRAQAARLRRPGPGVGHPGVRRLHLLGRVVHHVEREPPPRGRLGVGAR